MQGPADRFWLARAKVNLCLHITDKRDDGFHLLDSIVVFPNVGDVLTVQESPNISMTIDGPFAAGLSNTDNSVIKAAQLLFGGTGAKINLTKNLPVASGIGGGSSDAATAIRMLADWWNTAPPVAADILTLGADVPVCMAQTAQHMQGIGEKLSPLAGLPRFAMVLVNSGCAVSTAAVFGNLEKASNPKIGDNRRFDTALMLFEYLSEQRNDMQNAAIKTEPDIQRVLNAIQSQSDCHLARMSGSGGTCFGLFATLKDAQAAATRLSTNHPDWWVAAAEV